MKLVATSSFRTPPGVELVFEKPQPHKLHVPKAARFSIGGDTPFEKLGQTEKRVIAELNLAGRIVSRDQTEAVAQIDAELAAEMVTEKRIADGTKR